MARQLRSTGHQHGVSRYSLATQRALGRTKLRPPVRQAPSTQRLAVKQEELDAGIDVNANYITQVDASNDVDGPPLCYKPKKPYHHSVTSTRKLLEYIHRPLTADSAPKYEVKEIHLKEGQSIFCGSRNCPQRHSMGKDNAEGLEVNCSVADSTNCHLRIQGCSCCCIMLLWLRTMNDRCYSL